MPPYTPPVPEHPNELIEEIEALEEIEVPDEEPQDDEEMDEDLVEVSQEELEAYLNQGDTMEDDSGDTPTCHHDTPPTDMAKVTFRKHTKPVFSCALLAEHNLAVTGCEDDCVYVWDINTLEVIKEITGHKDTVQEVHFNHDNTYLATGDMSGQIFAFKYRFHDNKHSFQEAWQFAMGDMTWMRWHPYGNVLAAGSKEGEVYVWRIPTGECRILGGNGVRSENGDWSNDGKQLLVGYANGNVRLWDMKTCTAAWEVNENHPQAHTESVQAVACSRDAPFYASGDETGKILLHASNGPVGSVMCDGFVECLAMSPSNEFRMIASGTLSGQLAVWDYSKYSLRTICQNPNDNDTITRIKWIDQFTIVASTCMGYIHGFDARSGELQFTLTGHWSDIYEMSYDAPTKTLLTVSEDWTAKIFKIP